MSTYNTRSVADHDFGTTTGRVLTRDSDTARTVSDDLYPTSRRAQLHTETTL